jgi:hypothetical protein
VGVVVTIDSCQSYPDGRLLVHATGTRRVLVQALRSEAGRYGLWSGEYAALPDRWEEPEPGALSEDDDEEDGLPVPVPAPPSPMAQLRRRTDAAPGPAAAAAAAVPAADCPRLLWATRVASLCVEVELLAAQAVSQLRVAPRRIAAIAGPPPAAPYRPADTPFFQLPDAELVEPSASTLSALPTGALAAYAAALADYVCAIAAGSGAAKELCLLSDCPAQRLRVCVLLLQDAMLRRRAQDRRYAWVVLAVALVAVLYKLAHFVDARSKA